MLARIPLTLFCFYSGWFLANELLRLRLSEAVDRVLAWATLGLAVAGSVLLLLGTQRFRAVAGKNLTAMRRSLLLLLTIVMIALHLRAMAVERVEVAGDSMHPTLRHGERIWIEKLSTGLQLPDLSFPFGSLSATGKAPAFGLQLLRRGDIVVFRYPGMNASDRDQFVKRVIALPGDRYELRSEGIWINGAPLAEPYLNGSEALPPPQSAMPPIADPPPELDLLDGEVRYSAYFGVPWRGRVPANCLLLLGDNRALSRDSRSIGFVPGFFVIGRRFTLW